MGNCCLANKKKEKKKKRENEYIVEDAGQNVKKKPHKQPLKQTQQQNINEQPFSFPPPQTYLKGQGISIGTGQNNQKNSLTPEEIKKRQLEAAEKRAENNQNRGLTTQAQIDMIFKAEHAQNAEKFGNQQYNLKYK